MSPEPVDRTPAELARYYDLDASDLMEDLEMFLALANESGGGVLELAVGSGRLAIPIASAGHDVVGVDDDPAMLDRAHRGWLEVSHRAGAGTLRLQEGDIRTYRSDQRFGLIVLAMNTMLVMDDDGGRLAVLSTAREHLRSGGTFVMDVLDPAADEIEIYDGRLQLEWLRPDPETGEEVTKLVSARYDPDTMTVALVQLFDVVPVGGGPVRRVQRADTLHLVEGDHWLRLAALAGFDEAELKGDHRLTPHGAGSHRSILLARSL